MLEGEPLRLVEHVEQPVAKQETRKDGEAVKEPKALECYGLYLHVREQDGSLHKRVWLRFVDGRPVSEITCRYLEWCCEQLQALGMASAPLRSLLAVAVPSAMMATRCVAPFLAAVLLAFGMPGRVQRPVLAVPRLCHQGRHRVTDAHSSAAAKTMLHAGSLISV